MCNINVCTLQRSFDDWNENQAKYQLILVVLSGHSGNDERQLKLEIIAR